jgi:hypothetical protein
MKTIEEKTRLMQKQLRLIANKEIAAGAEEFMGWPARWIDDWTVRCINDHVSKRVLRSSLKGNVCLKCEEPINITFPEDTDGPLETKGK